MLKRTLLVSLTLAAGTYLAAACSKKTPPPQAPENNISSDPGQPLQGGLPAGVRDGALWTCAIDDYDPQPCKFHQDGGGWRLTKLMGSQRFDGTAEFTAEGIKVVGEFFCPWGDCTSPVDAVLAPDEGGAGYTGTVSESQVKLWWDEENAADFGGAGYGGLTGHEI